MLLLENERWSALSRQQPKLGIHISKNSAGILVDASLALWTWPRYLTGTNEVNPLWTMLPEFSCAE
jgi:hypothetical protein